MPSKVIFPTELGPLGEKARLTAAHLARVLKAELVAMHAVEKHGELAMIVAGDEFEAQRQAIEANLTEFATQLEVEGKVPVTTLVKAGQPSKCIVEAASEIGAEIMVFGTVGGTGLRDTLLGSGANHIIRHSPCPVLTVRNPREESGFHRIVVHIETQREVPEQVAWAVKFAKLYEAEIHFLGLTTGNADHNHQIDVRLRNSVKFAHAQGLAEVFMHLDPMEDSTEEEIEHYAKTINADLICVLSQSDDEKGVLTMLRGGCIADRVVNFSQFPVLSVTPSHH